MVNSPSQDTKLKLVFTYLVLSASSVRGIPFFRSWGLDFQNIYAYAYCVRGKVPYLLPGAACGDWLGRAMVYPPFLFHSFAWVRTMSFGSAISVWSAVSLVGLSFVFYAWVRLIARESRPGHTAEVVLFCALLALQYPFVFLLERGGTDVVPLVLWAITAYFFCRGRLLLAGIGGGAAAAFKLYPAIPCAVLTFALLVAGWQRSSFKRTDFLRFGGSAFATLVVINLCLLRDARIYFTVTLPKFASATTEAATFSHSLPSFAGDTHNLYWRLPALLLFALWCWTAWTSLASKPAVTLAGVLAMSTYFSGTSWDYALVTTFPLLTLSFLEARRSNRWFSLALGLVAIVGDREMFAGDWLGLFNPTTHLALQLAWLVVVAFEIAQPLAAEMPKARLA